MGINTAFSNWLSGAQSTLNAGIRAAQAQAAALQQQTMTALSGVQRAVTQPLQQQTSSRSSRNQQTARTTTSVDYFGDAARAVQSGARAVQEGVGQIARAHTPIVQGVRRDVGRAIQATPAAVRSAPVAIQQGVQQVTRAHAPIAQGIQRDVGRAIQATPAAVRSAPAAIQSGARQIAQAHAPIVQGIQRDIGRSIPGAGTPQRTSPKVVSPSPTGMQPGGTRPIPGAGPAPSPAQTPQQRVERYAQDVQRFNAAPAHAQLPGLIVQHKTAVEQYGIDPELRQYEQKLSAYNAQLAAHQRAAARGLGRQETANRLQSMQQELTSWGGRIDARKRQELGGIRMLEANVRMVSTPLQIEYQRLQAEGRALTPARLSAGAKAQQGETKQEWTKPIFDFGQAASRWWTKNAAPAIEGGIDRLPYLGPQTVPVLRPGPSGVGGRSGDAPAQVSPGTTRGEWAVVPAAPLQGGGTRLQPRWEGDLGHDLMKGVAVDLPQHALEFATALPLGLERFGGALLKDPGKAMGTLAGGFGAVASGMSDAAKENPARFTGEMVGSLVLGPKVGRGVKSGGGAVTRQVSKLSPGYERGMTSYTGVPRLRDVARGDATLPQYLAREPTRFTPPTDRATVVDPALSQKPHSFYHATDDVFGQIGAMERKITVDAGKPSPVESSLFFGPPSVGLARFLPADGGAFIKVRAPVRPYSPRTTTLIEQGAPRSVIEPLVTREFHRAPAGEILPGVKPASGKTFHGELQGEYMAKPGTQLYRVENWRTRLYDRAGLTRGTGWTRDPLTGRKAEIYEFSLEPQPASGIKPIVDIPALERNLHYNPTFEKLVFGARKVGSAARSPLRRLDERVAERTLVREMKRKGIPDEDIKAFQAGVRLGRAVKGMDSPTAGDVILDALTEIGPEYAADLQAILRENPAVLYGSGMATGQTPRPVWWRGFKDLDVHLERKAIPKFIKDAKAMYKRHGLDVTQRGLSLVDKKTGNVLLDIHEAPTRYPLIGKNGGLTDPYAELPQTRPFSFVPDELLRGRNFLQERLYTQAQRKLSSITEQLEAGKVKPSRKKDFGDGILTVEALLDYAESLLRPDQILQARRYRTMRADLEVLKSNPKIKPIWEEALKEAQDYRAAHKVLLDKALREEFGVGDNVQITPELIKQIADEQFIRSNRLTKPTKEMVQDARTAVARGEIQSRDMASFLAERVEQANRLFAESVRGTRLPAPPTIRIRSRPSTSNWREPGTLVLPGMTEASSYGGALLPGAGRVAPSGSGLPTTGVLTLGGGQRTPPTPRSPPTERSGGLSPSVGVRSPTVREASPLSTGPVGSMGRSLPAPTPLAGVTPPPPPKTPASRTPPSPPLYGSPSPTPYPVPPGTPYPTPYPEPPYYPETITPPDTPKVPPDPVPFTPPERPTRRGTEPRPRGKRKKEDRYNPHWELGPAPGTDEMAAMIFGSGSAHPAGGSVLDFGPPSIGVTGAPPQRATATAPGKKPAHAEKPRRPRAGQPDAMDLLYGGLGRPRDLATPPRPAAKKKAKKR